MSSHRRPLLAPFEPLELFIPTRSRLLSRSVPPANFPIDGAPIPRSLRLLAFPLDLNVGFSRIIPFSRASRLRVSSLFVAFACIPTQWDFGIFCCPNIDFFAPRDCSLRSRALCRLTPVGFRSEADSRRCDSFKRRCRAKSFFKFSASPATSASSLPFVALLALLPVVVDGSDSDGGFADYNPICLNMYATVHVDEATHHERFADMLIQRI